MTVAAPRIPPPIVVLFACLAGSASFAGGIGLPLPPIRPTETEAPKAKAPEVEAPKTENPKAPEEETTATQPEPAPIDPGGVAGAISEIWTGRSTQPSPIRISGSVGKGGVNRPEDVRAIQDGLVERGFLEPGTFEPGVADKATIDAIRRFQSEKAGFHNPDGRVDVGQRTLQALNGLTRERPFRTKPRTGPRASSSKVAPTVDRGDVGQPAKELPADGKAKADESDGPRDAYAELERLGVPYRPVGSRLGISDPVEIGFPLLGVDFVYFAHSSSKPRTVDVRLAVALAHLALFVRDQGVVRINHAGMHVTRRKGKTETKKKTNDHARGLAIDLSSFVFDDGRTIKMTRDWLTGRSATYSHQPGIGGVVKPTSTELEKMSADERWLRNLWGFLHTEFNWVVTPSHNKQHWNHFHAGLRSTPRQKSRSMSSFKAAGHLD